LPSLVRGLTVRLGVLALQVFGVVTLVFVLVRLLPGNPAFLLAGPNATRAGVEAIQHRLGLDQSIFVQYGDYLSALIRGDLGDAFSTGNPVLTDLRERFPATLMIISLALFTIAALTLTLALVIARWPKGFVARAASGYSFVAGALPDFWIGLALIFVFYTTFGLVPAPASQVDPLVAAPVVTGAAAIDGLIAGDMAAFSDALGHLFLPVLTLVLVYVGPVLRLTAQATTDGLDQDFIRFGRALGLGSGRLASYALRSALPVFVTVLGSTYGYLLGGAVLVEVIFSWGGLGQYAVEAITRSDYVALQGFVLVAGIFTALVYLAVDGLYFLVNPRGRAT
jgi:ABC-type dipeptide/oligopeptide/nickel transport system permease component